MNSLLEYLQAHPKKVLIFDFDSTLFKLDLPWQIYNREVLKIVAQQDPQWAIDNVQNTTFVNNFLDIIIDKYGEPIRQKLNDYTKTFESQQLRGYRENPQLIQFVEDHCADYDIYLWTTNMKTTVEPILSKYDIDSCFKFLVTRDAVKQIKPYTDGFELIQKIQPLEKTDYLMIGDSRADRDAASTAGIDFFPIHYFKN